MRPRTSTNTSASSISSLLANSCAGAIEADRLYSAIFHGPPGTGKTSLAEVIARATKAKFERLSGVESTVSDIRRVIATAANRLRLDPNARTILFIDEIHRFNRAQQDALLPDVERGTVRLLGATTENPFFAVNGPLVSRSQGFPVGAADAGRSRSAAATLRSATPSAVSVNMPSGWTMTPRCIWPRSATATRANV